MQLDDVRSEIERMRAQVNGSAGDPPASAAGMRRLGRSVAGANAQSIDELCAERDRLKKSWNGETQGSRRPELVIGHNAVLTGCN